MADVVLGIETSCDETSAAVLVGGGRAPELASLVILSQDVHQVFGGVVPELASRAHLAALPAVVERALVEAGVGWGAVDAVAVTQGPGLVGALLVGVVYAKALAYAGDRALVGVHHMEGHLFAPAVEDPELAPPFVALLVSGGHTLLLDVPAWGTYRLLGATRDDAAGEAFDKVAKLLGLGYPGGPLIDRLAPHGDFRAVKFPAAQIKHRDRRDGAASGQSGNHDRPHFDFSYSGIKTAVLRYVETHNLQASIEGRRRVLVKISKPTIDDYLAHCDKQTLNLVASFQHAVVEDLVSKTLAAARTYDVATLLVTGGVAANNELRERFDRQASRDGLPVYFPSRPLSTDNAAMIAAAAYPKFLAKDLAPTDFSAEAGMALR